MENIKDFQLKMFDAWACFLIMLIKFSLMKMFQVFEWPSWWRGLQGEGLETKPAP